MYKVASDLHSLCNNLKTDNKYKREHFGKKTPNFILVWLKYLFTNMRFI